jgi:alpha-galactosidase
MKIVIIGAGSRVFGRCQILDLLGNKELRQEELIISLVDVNEKALDLMTRLAERIREHLGSRLTIESTTDRTQALPGADYVITAVTLNRYDLWEQDYRVPRALGFNHIYGENGGPGALFHTLRNLDIIMPICTDIERLCPDALLLNFTNPEARILHAISHLTNVKAVGICHGFFDALGPVTRYLGREPEELEIVSAGMNHLFYFLKVKDKKSGEDLLPQLHQQALADPKAGPLFKKLIEHFGGFSYPSDHHTGEYLSFGDGFDNGMWVYGRELKPVHNGNGNGKDPGDLPLEEYADGSREIDVKVLKHHHELSVPIICAMENDTPIRAESVNVVNNGGYIENLPKHGVVEVPAKVDGQGIHPESVGPLPESWAAVVRTQYSIHKLITEGYHNRDKKALLQALLLDPTCRSVTAAEKLMERMFYLQKDFLPEFA